MRIGKVLAEDVIGEASPVRRMVTEYIKTDQEDHPELGRYRVNREGVEFSQYLKENGYNVIALTREEQLEYGCNVINLGNGNIVGCNQYGIPPLSV